MTQPTHPPPPAAEPETPVSNGVTVTVRNLRRDLGGRPVLRGLDFEVNRGEIFVVMGPSGSGKSVLLKHLIGLETPDSGEIRIEGQPIQADGVLDRFRVAMVFQSGALLNSLTVAENVGLYLTEHRLHAPDLIRRIVSAKLDLLGLGGEEDRYPAELSGGMKKRVAIARALVIEPHLILYDEPTSELDPLMAAVIAEQILHLRQRIGVTSLVVTHDRELAFGIADRMALLDHGQFITLGRPAEVRSCGHPLARRFLTAEFSPRDPT
jgi:phospholipid/cholesterol/gamma-HCH transport system ATP-binding protein